MFTSPDTLIPDQYNPLDWNRYSYGRNNPLKYTDPDGHLPIIPLLIVGGIALMKAIDYGWTAYDAYQSSQVLADPNASQAAKDMAAANLAMTVAFEAAEPDELLPVSLPLDDLARLGAKEGLSEVMEQGTESTLRLVDDVPTSPKIKTGSAGGPTAGKSFPDSVRKQAFDEDPTKTCVWCGMPGTATDVDHVVPKSKGGNATIDNAQLACPHCNRSRQNGQFPKTPPEGYRGPWPPNWWPK